ncbi:hypothetical protein C8F04DRAFT_1261742 [Mycena alexandri]|uniref:Uncharacterized protein n=1 Tax=Mycena alexandri TaxID=1745969 RepID=A0AAD6SRF3_9AGAR|nr:hypothetical protein C8F04DRAFT_1261742 [Mycena alexandri]
MPDYRSSGCGGRERRTRCGNKIFLRDSIRSSPSVGVKGRGLGDRPRPSTNYGGWWTLPLRRPPPSPPSSSPVTAAVVTAAVVTATVVTADSVPSATAIMDTEPEDSEPYLNTSHSDTTIATTDTEAAGPTPPLPRRTSPHRAATTSSVAPKGSGRWWSSLPGMRYALLHISSTRRGDGMRGRPLVDVKGHILSVLIEDPLTAHLHWLHADPLGWNGRPLVNAKGRIFAVLAKDLSQLIRIGFTWIHWDGIQGWPLVDANRHIFAGSPVNLIPPPTPPPSPTHSTCSL